jgi:transposase-like protein
MRWRMVIELTKGDGTVHACEVANLCFKRSFRDLVEMMAERGLSLLHTTIMRWVHHHTPEYERCWNRFARSVGLRGV